MIVSYNWLKTYFANGALPKPEDLAAEVTMRIFEVEELTPIKNATEEARGAMAEVAGNSANDYAMDFKILPDRAGYAYAHRFIAQEIAAMLKTEAIFPVHAEPESSAEAVRINVENTELCPLYIGRKINGINNTASPAWLASYLQTVGQRSINLVVDLTNYAMLDTGQPMHAFDADKVVGGITVRNARAGEKIELLDGRIVELDESILVIADDEGPLALGGIKGGKKAEVTLNTKNIILESANFNPVYVRRTSQKLNIKNDSTKRFENAVTHERAMLAMKEYCHLLKTSGAMNDGSVFESIVKIGDDAYEQRTVSVKVAYICQRIGVEISADEMLDVLNTLDLKASLEGGDTINVLPPQYRNDIAIPEDIVDEIGRMHGYEHLVARALPQIAKGPVLKSAYYANLVRSALLPLGFSEVFTYSLRESGDYQLANPLNADRCILRYTISDIFAKVFDKNVSQLDLLELDKIAIFEIGKIFKDKTERLSLALGITTREGKQKAGIIETAQSDALSAIISALSLDKILPENGIKAFANQIAPGIIEIDFDGLLKQIPEPADSVTSEAEPLKSLAFASDVHYKKFSPYPYITRDIAVFIPGPTGKAVELRGLIESVGSDLIVRLKQFDEFEKKNKETGEIEKTSYAFRMVFQSFEKTLTDGDVQSVMDQILAKIAAKQAAGENWEVR